MAVLYGKIARVLHNERNNFTGLQDQSLFLVAYLVDGLAFLKDVLS